MERASSPAVLDVLARTSRQSVVHVHDPRVRWSVPAAEVVRIVARADWHGPALDVLTALGAPAGAASPAGRVVIIRTGGRERAIYAAGSIDITDVEPARVLALPASLAPLAPQVAAVIVAADGSLSLLLSSSAVPTDDDGTVPGEELWPRRS